MLLLTSKSNPIETGIFFGAELRYLLLDLVLEDLKVLPLQARDDSGYFDRSQSQ